jgi:putative drug exporter of the RND superfamily
MARLLYKLGFFSHQHRLLIVLLWVFALVGGGVGATTLAGETSNSFSIPGQESTTALEKITTEFGGARGTTAQVVVKAPAGEAVTAPANAATVKALVGTLGQLPGVASASDPLNPAAPTIAPDQTTAYSTVTYPVGRGEVTDEQREALLLAVDQARSDGWSVEVGGEAVMTPPHVAGAAEGIGVIIALLILALTYGSLVTAGMNLLTAVVGVGIGILGITITTGFVELQSTTPTLAAMLGLAVGIDYALFIVSRYRQELLRGADVGTAVGISVGTAGSAVVTAGLTVIIALAGLFVVGIPFLTQMGLAAAATIVVAVLIAVTLVPAVLSYLGRRALPRKQRAASAVELPAGESPAVDSPKFLTRWVGAVTRRRVPALILSVVALAVIALPVFSLQSTLVQSPAEGSTQARAQELLAGGFGAGVNGPLTILFDGSGAAQSAAQVSGAIKGLPDVAVVTSPIPNADGSAALLTVIPKSGPTSEATVQLVTDLRALLATTDGPEAYVTGATAVSVDVAQSLDSALPVYLALVVGLALVLLVLVFRSLLVPVVGVLGFLLSLGASLGATVAVFQWGWLADAVNLDSTGPLLSLAPILVIGILFGLAMDYQVFLVSRMHEAHSHGASPIDAIRTGFRQSAPIVVAAAAIMFAVFAGFVPAGETTIKSIAFALAIGILMDAFVVRMVLVPAALALLGRWAWWLPRGLGWLPTLDVEGAGLAQEKGHGPRDTDEQGEPVSAGVR